MGGGGGSVAGTRSTKDGAWEVSGSPGMGLGPVRPGRGLELIRMGTIWLGKGLDQSEGAGRVTMELGAGCGGVKVGIGGEAALVWLEMGCCWLGKGLDLAGMEPEWGLDLADPKEESIRSAWNCGMC